MATHSSDTCCCELVIGAVLSRPDEEPLKIGSLHTADDYCLHIYALRPSSRNYRLSLMALSAAPAIFKILMHIYRTGFLHIFPLLAKAIEQQHLRMA